MNNKHQQLAHPFLALLRDLTSQNESTQAQRGHDVAAQRNGKKRVHLASKKAAVQRPIIKKILNGDLIPSVDEIGRIAEDYGLERGQQGYADFNRIGCEYIEHYKVDKQCTHVEKVISARKNIPDSSTPPATLGSALKLIRSSRYFIPYADYTGDPVLTKQEYEALRPSQKKMAKQLGQREVVNRGRIFNYNAYEGDRAGITLANLYNILAFMKATPDEIKIALDLYDAGAIKQIADKVDTDEAELIYRYRHAVEKTQGALAHSLGYKDQNVISAIECCQATKNQYLRVLQQLGYDSSEALEADVSYFESKCRDACIQDPFDHKKQRIQTSQPMDPQHAILLRRYRVLTGMTQIEMARCAEYNNASVVHKAENGLASKEQFFSLIKKLGFDSPGDLEIEVTNLTNERASGFFKRELDGGLYR